LRLSSKSAAKPLEKLLKSAIANAENRENPIDVEHLVVREIFVDGGPLAKRWRPASMGRAFPLIKRHSHVTIKLANRPDGD